MNKDQMEMLSIKSAIERTVSGYIAAFKTSGDCSGFLCEIERYLAALFVSNQITNDHSVVLNKKDIDVRFVARGQYCTLTFLIPSELQPKPEPPKTQAPNVLVQDRYELDIRPELVQCAINAGQSGNSAIVRERVKKDMYEILHLNDADFANTWVTCDETNNVPCSDKLSVDIEALLDNKRIVDRITVDATAIVQPPAVRSSFTMAFIVSAVYTALMKLTNDKDEVDQYFALQSDLQERLAVHDFAITPQKTETESCLRFTFSVQLYADSDWVAYPIHHLFKH